MQLKIGIIVTYFGAVEATFDKETDAFICPACKNFPDLTQRPTPEQALLVCMTEGCPLHVKPEDYVKCYEMVLEQAEHQQRMNDVDMRSGRVGISTAKIMQEIIEAYQAKPPTNPRLQ